MTSRSSVPSLLARLVVVAPPLAELARATAFLTGTMASAGCLLAIGLLHVGRLDGLAVLARLLAVGGLAFAVGYGIEERTTAASGRET